MANEDLKKEDGVEQIEKAVNVSDQPLSDDELKPITGGAHSPAPQIIDTCLL